MLTVPPSQFLRRYLVLVGAVSETGDWQAKITASLPPTPDNIMSITDTTPLLDGRVQRAGEVIKHPGIQIRIRSKFYPDGWARGELVAAALASLTRYTVVVSAQSALLEAFTVSSGLTSIGPEEQNLREHFTINGTLTLKES